MLLLTKDEKIVLTIIIAVVSAILLCLILFLVIKCGVFFPAAPKFNISDISYDSFDGLKIEFKNKQDEIQRSISDLQSKYFDNSLVRSKIKSYELYKAAMDSVEISCKESPSHGKCNNCVGDGKVFLGRKCKKCNGSGHGSKCPCQGDGYLDKSDIEK